MQLSKNAQDYVRNLAGKKIQEVNEWNKEEVARLGNWQRGAGQSAAIVRQNLERLRRSAAAQVEAYLEGYKLDGKIPDDADIEEISTKIRQSITGAIKHYIEFERVDTMAETMRMEGQSMGAEVRRDLKMAAQRMALELERNKQAIPSQSPSSSQMDFSFVVDGFLAVIIKRDYAELQSLDPKMNAKSVLVLSGGIIEGLLLDALVVDGKWSFEEGAQKFLKELIGPAVARGIIREDKLTDAVRRYRDLIHPGREIREQIRFSDADAKVARGAVDVVIREVRDWHEKRQKAPSTT